MESTRRGRTFQVFRWLYSEFPPPYPTELHIRNSVRWRQRKCAGETSWQASRLTVDLDGRLTWMDAIETLLHEWGHVASWQQVCIEWDRPHHDDEWALMYGRIYRAYHDDDGRVRSRDY